MIAESAVIEYLIESSILACQRQLRVFEQVDESSRRSEHLGRCAKVVDVALTNFNTHQHLTAAPQKGGDLLSCVESQLIDG